MKKSWDLADIIGRKLERALEESGENLEFALGGASGSDALRVSTTGEIARLLATFHIPRSTLIPTPVELCLPEDSQQGAYIVMAIHDLLHREKGMIADALRKYRI